MKTFNIYQYQTPGGHPEAIKDGWSWPGFFFSWIWAFIKGLTKLGVGLLAVSIVLRVLAATDDMVNILASVVGLGIACWVGYNGNRMRGDKLLSEGYEKVASVEASSPESAVSAYQASLGNAVQVPL